MENEITREKYPTHALGTLADPVEALARITRTPVEMCAHGVITAVSLALQDHADVELLNNNRCPISIWTVTVAESGEGKSTVERYALEGVRRHQDNLQVEYSIDYASYISLLELYEAKRLHLRRLISKETDKLEKTKLEADYIALVEPAKPLRPLKVINDPTIEGLFFQFRDGHLSLSFITDEAAQFFGGFTMNRDNIHKSLAGFSKYYDGVAQNRTRKEGGSDQLNGVRLGVSLQMQPRYGEQLFNNPAYFEQGFANRFLFAWPESNIGKRTLRGFEANPVDEQAVQRFNDRIYGLLEGHRPPVAETGLRRLEPRLLRLSSGAKDALLSLHDDYELAAGEGEKWHEYRGYTSKLSINAVRLAALMTLYEDESATEVSANSMKNAGRLMQWYLSEVSRCHGVTGVTEEEKEEDKILRFINRNNNISVTSRDIQRGTKLKAQQVRSSLYRLMEAELVVANENKYQLAG